MKKIISFTIALVLIGIGKSYSQASCGTQISNYSGPKNTTELIVKLTNSSNPIISNLNANIKQALIDYTVFENNFPRGNANNSNTYIEQLFGSNNGSEILAAIFDCPVHLFTYATKPAYPSISWSNFMSLYNSDPAKYAHTTSISACTNCYFATPGVCCAVGGKGCYDKLTEIIVSGEHYYVIHE